jgi:hypothetical protein
LIGGIVTGGNSSSAFWAHDLTERTSMLNDPPTAPSASASGGSGDFLALNGNHQ